MVKTNGILIMTLKFLPLTASICMLSLVEAMGGAMSDLTKPIMRPVTVKITLFNRGLSADGISMVIDHVLADEIELIEFDEAIVQNVFSYVTIHGFTTGHENEWAHELKDRILTASNANVFIVDWSENTEFPPYLSLPLDNILNYAWIVAQYVASFFNQLDIDNLDKVHFIAHSIGARIANSAINSIQTLVGQMTALDPYKRDIVPVLDFIPGQKKINSNTYSEYMSNTILDAPFYSTILHTDTSGLGMDYNCGTLDIYVNGGSQQPGCPELEQDSNLMWATNCNHQFATEFFKSISLHGLADALMLNSDLRTEYFKAEITKCFPMAYQCDTYQAFVNGYCGGCPDRSEDFNALCVLAGIPDTMVEYAAPPHIGNISTIYALKTDIDGGCLYSYRILVGVRRRRGIMERPERSLEDRVFVRLSLSDNPSHAKTFELSDRPSHYYLQNTTLMSQFVNHKGMPKLSSKGLDSTTFSPFRMDMRSLLVTFRLKTSNAGIEPSIEEIDRPFEKINLVDVWGKNVRKVQFVAVDYLSHPDFEVREKHSLLFTRQDLDKEKQNQDLPFLDYFATFSFMQE